jgi:opacity protein-like surface antigen
MRLIGSLTMEDSYLMRNKILLVGAVVVLALVASAFAADVTGKWVAQVQGRQGMTENTFNFKVEGATLTGTLTTAQGETAISEGKVSGDEISFIIVRKFQENEMKILYKGKVAGDEITFTREFQGGMMGGPPGGGAGAPPGGGAGAPPGGGGGMGGPPPPIVAKRVK